MEVTKAICVLKGPGGISGTINLKAGEGGHTTTVTGEIFGLTPGKHGLHVHTFGDVSKDFPTLDASAYFPNHDILGMRIDTLDMSNYLVQKGLPVQDLISIPVMRSMVHHKIKGGDLGNIEADENGIARFELEDRLLRLAGKHSIIGRSMVVHENEDDLGKGGNSESLESGNQGAGLAWGIIGIDEDPK